MGSLNPVRPRNPFSDQPASGLSTDRELVDKCLAGDDAAWHDFVERFGRLVYTIPHRYGLDEDRCGDVYQDVFAIVLRQLPTLRDQASLPKWLITLSKRVTWRVIRETKRQAEMPEPPVQHALSAEDEALQLEQQHLVRVALERLGGRCEQLLRALYMDGSAVEYAAISRRLEIPIGSIGPTRARCLKKLLTILRGDKPQDDQSTTPF